MSPRTKAGDDSPFGDVESVVEPIVSQADPSVVLHLIVRPGAVEENSRIDLAPAAESLQCAILHLRDGATFPPHRHLVRELHLSDYRAQESWVVIRGRVLFHCFDEDDTWLCSRILHPGDLSLTFRGGHTYEALDDGTLVIEFKTGPYEGHATDKVRIDWQGPVE